jgi:hypothetical protein
LVFFFTFPFYACFPFSSAASQPPLYIFHMLWQMVIFQSVLYLCAEMYQATQGIHSLHFSAETVVTDEALLHTECPPDKFLQYPVNYPIVCPWVSKFTTRSAAILSNSS